MDSRGLNPTGGKYAYSTYGGCDINLMIGNKVLVGAQAISYAVTREKVK